MKEIIRKKVLEFGADVCGFANINRFQDAPEGFHPNDIFVKCKSVISLGISLPRGLACVEPRLIYGHFNNTTCHEVDKLALRTAKLIEKQFGKTAVPLPCDIPYEYWDARKSEGRGLLSMKHAAMLAGLGTLGKNTLLLNKDFGNLLILGAVLTDLDIKSDEMAESICIEGCSLCLRNCPAGALNGEHADQQACRANTYGKTVRGFDTVECNKCRTICPRRFGLKDNQADRLIQESNL